MPQHDELPSAEPEAQPSWADTPAWHEEMATMIRMSGDADAPEDGWMLGGAQELAGVLAEARHLMTIEQRAILTGVGALLLRESRKELGAMLEAWKALGMVRTVRRDMGSGEAA